MSKQVDTASARVKRAKSEEGANEPVLQMQILMSNSA